VVLRKMTDWYRARLVSVNRVASSVVSTAKLLVPPSAWIRAMPFVIDAWRKPAVAENTSTLNAGDWAEAVQAEITHSNKARLKIFMVCQVYNHNHIAGWPRQTSPNRTGRS